MSRSRRKDLTSQQIAWRSRLLDAAVSIAHRVITGSFVALIFWRGFAAAEVFAGQQTTTNMLFQVATDLGLDRWIAYSGAAAMGGWAWHERRLRRRKTPYLTGRIQDLEKSIDPKRSSSKLTPEGESRPEDY